jgi:DNA (cytosine-5)-methyltransferase 1
VRPLILDLFCGAGGAAVGYHRAGFDVIGIDLNPQPNYPFEFLQMDALTALCEIVSDPRTKWGRFAGIHTSPPCQASSNLTRGTNRETKAQNHTNLIPVVRELLKLTGLPWVIENVQGAHMRRDLTLCGEMFGLDVIRHRYFEVSGFEVQQPTHVKHRGKVRGWRHGEYFDGPYVAVYGDGGGKGTVKEWQQAMGIDWTNDRKEIADAIPPAYSEFVGLQLIAQIESRRAA